MRMAVEHEHRYTPLLLTDSFAGQTTVSVCTTRSQRRENRERYRDKDQISQTTFLSQTSVHQRMPQQTTVLCGFSRSPALNKDQSLDEAPSTHRFLRLLRLIRGRGGAICHFEQVHQDLSPYRRGYRAFPPGPWSRHVPSRPLR